MDINFLNYLAPYFQYQFDNQKNIVGAEILMRPIVGNISDVIKILTNNNEIHFLDINAFNYALKLQEKNKGLNCSSNVSGQSLSKKLFADYVCLQDPVCGVTLELIENCNYKTLTLKNINYLSKFGFKFSLDDFGSGFNGLNRLATLQLSEVKIDRHLIKLLPDSSRAITIIKQIIFLIKDLQYTIVAEGIETNEQFEILADLGCDRFQGFLLHKPEPFV